MALFPAQWNLFRFTKRPGAVAADSFRLRIQSRNRRGIFPFRLRQRRGIFIGTREFSVPSRNHLLAISSVLKLGQPVTVINTEGWTGARLLRSISRDLRIISGKLPYTDYLCLLARHRIVFQLDRSAVPGQVAGDALLCGLPCVGGDGAVDKLAFPGLCGDELAGRIGRQGGAKGSLPMTITTRRPLKNHASLRLSASASPR